MCHIQMGFTRKTVMLSNYNVIIMLKVFYLRTFFHLMPLLSSYEFTVKEDTNDSMPFLSVM